MKFPIAVLSLTLLAAGARALELRVMPQSAGEIRVRATLRADMAEQGEWRWRIWRGPDWGPWSKQGSTDGVLRLAATERLVEVEFRIESEAGWQLGRCTLPGLSRAPAGVIAQRASRRAGKESGVLSGRLLYQDRRFGLAGYLGTRRLPLRRCELELRRASDDSLLARAASDEEGWFAVPLDLDQISDVRIEIVSLIRQPGLALDVVDLADQPWRLQVALATALQPGSSIDFGPLLLVASGVEAFNILDTALDAVQLLADPLFVGALPDSGSVPPLRYEGAAPIALTAYDGSEFLISNAAAGDSDAWSDCLILAAMGSWVQESFGHLDQWGAIDPSDPLLDVRRALGDGQSMAFAALVRNRRAQLRLDADGAPADADVQQFVDLPTAPPVGIPVGAEWGVDLEARLLNGASIAPRGQRSAFNVGCLLYDLLDGVATMDGSVADDDSLDEVGGRWFRTSFGDMASLSPTEPISYEDVHFAWLARYGDAQLLLDLGADQGGCALRADADEPNETLPSAATLPLWIQPPLSSGASARLGELFLGERDAVELINPGDTPLDIGGYRVVTRRNGFSSGSERTTIVPSGTVLEPGRSLLLHEGLGPAPSSSDIFDASWNIPWRHDEDGACTLQNASAQAIEFVRWAGANGADPSSTPVPAGTSFSGLLIAPEAEPFTLGRDSLGTDGDAAADFQARLPTPRVPNATLRTPRSLVPNSDFDLLRVAGSEDLSRLEIHAFEAVDDAHPCIAWMDSLAQSLVESAHVAALSGENWLALASLDGAAVRARLRQDAAALSSAAWQLFAWLPRSDRSLLAVSELQATPLLLDPDFDTVQLAWSNVGSYDSLRILVDAAPLQTISGTAESFQVALPAGRHAIEVIPRTGGFEGASARTSFYVGPTACAAQHGMESLEDILGFELTGFTPTGQPYLGNSSLRDGTGSDFYPPNDTALATLRLPIDMTSDAELSFVHHCHLLPDGDRAYVEVSADDGTHWQTMASYDGALHSGGGDAANWGDGLLEAGDWVQESLSLAQFAGQRLRLRFRRVSNASGSSLGWGIDEIQFGSSHRGAWMDPAGSDDFGCGHRERPFRTAGRAWAAVAVDDTLHVSAGLHVTPSPVLLGNESRTAIVPLRAHGRVVGQGAAATTLLANAADYAVLANLGPADSCHVQSLRIEGGRGWRQDGGSTRAHGLDFRNFVRAVELRDGAAQLDSCLIAEGDSAVAQRQGALSLRHCTIADVDFGVDVDSSAVSLRIERSILAYHGQTFLRLAAPDSTLLELSCNDFYSAPVPFVGLVSPVAASGNVDLPVYFCHRIGGDYALPLGAPQLDLPGCGAIGALPVGCSVPVAAEPAPSRGALSLSVRPNPFNPRAEILLVLPVDGEVEWAIFDARGRRVVHEARAFHRAGTLRWIWDGRDAMGRSVASGVYHLRLQAAGRSLNRSLVLIR